MLKSTSFIFDGIPSDQYGLMIYFLNDEDTKELELGTDIKIVEDRIPTRLTPIHYGVDMSEPIKFPLIMGSLDYLEDYDVDAILSWLTGHQQYKWLEYIDGDHYVRYKCLINEIRSVYINGLPVAFECEVQCDSQFAYEYPTTTEINIANGSFTYLNFLNRSSYNGYFYPELQIKFGNDCNSLSIINETDQSREFKINYFDRKIIDLSNGEKIKNTTIAQESSYAEENKEFISWVPVVFPNKKAYGDIIYGTNSVIALPVDSDIALYSNNNGETWEETKLPVSGRWTGCYGDDGFVAICTNPNTAVASYSQTGAQWNIAPIDLPYLSNWDKVFYVRTKGFLPDQYVAISKLDSSMIAISTSGQAWQSTPLPYSQEWKYIFQGNEKIIAIGGNTNIAAVSDDAINWDILELPKCGAWSCGCYGPNGFIIVPNSLYGSGTKEGIALTSTDGITWTPIELSIGAWNYVSCNSIGQYLVVGDRQYACSLDNVHYKVNTLPLDVTKLISATDKFICLTDTDKYISSSVSSIINGTFEVPIDAVDEKSVIKNVFVYAVIKDTAGDISYGSNGERQLASNSIDDKGENVITGGDNISLTTDLRFGLGIDGVMMSAVYDPEKKTTFVSFSADSNHTSVINAPLQVKIVYEIENQIDLNLDGLIVEINNQNQIIKSNKDTLNVYQYFNMNFLRLVKGVNKLKFSTEQGSCKVYMTCEFLKKVGGR